MTYTDVSEVMQRAYNLHRRADAEVLATRLAADLGLVDETEHETVRRLCRNPDGVYRTSPGFFVVAALARARGLSLDWLAAETLDYASEPRQP